MDKPRSGRPTQIDLAFKKAVLEKLEQEPPEGFGQGFLNFMDDLLAHLPVSSEYHVIETARPFVWKKCEVKGSQLKNIARNLSK